MGGEEDKERGKGGGGEGRGGGGRKGKRRGKVGGHLSIFTRQDTVGGAFSTSLILCWDSNSSRSRRDETIENLLINAC